MTDLLSWPSSLTAAKAASLPRAECPTTHVLSRLPAGLWRLEAVVSSFLLAVLLGPVPGSPEPCTVPSPCCAGCGATCCVLQGRSCMCCLLCRSFENNWNIYKLLAHQKVSKEKVSLGCGSGAGSGCAGSAALHGPLSVCLGSER